jgi:WD40 repeat protein
VHTLRGHGGGIMTGVIHAVALTPDSRRAVTASDDLTLRLWDLSSGTCDAVLAGHSGWVVDVKVTADGRHAISASHDGTARHDLTGYTAALRYQGVDLQNLVPIQPITVRTGWFRIMLTFIIAMWPSHTVTQRSTWNTFAAMWCSRNSRASRLFLWWRPQQLN